MNLAIMMPEWGIKLDEQTFTADVATLSVSTSESRDDGQFGQWQCGRLAAIAEAFGATWSIQFDYERTGLEFFVC